MFPIRKWNARLVYFLLQGGSSLAFETIFTINMIYQVTTVGLNPLQLVLVGTTLEVSAFIFEIPTGVVADVFSRRLSIIIGYVLMGLGFVVEGSLPTFEGVLLAQVIWGFGYTFTSGATEAWLVDEVGEDNAGPVFLRAAQIGQVTRIAGIVLAVILGSIVIRLPILLGGALLSLLGLVFILVMPETGFTPTPRAERSTWGTVRHTFGEGLAQVRGRPILVTMVFIGLLIGLFSEGYDRLSTPHLLNNFAIPLIDQISPVVWFGGMSLLGTPLSLLLVEFIRRRVDTRDNQASIRALMLVSGMMVITLIGFALAQSFLVAVMLRLCFGALRSATYPLSAAWTNQHIDSNVRATVLSMFSQVDAVGQIAGGPPIGWVGQVFGVRAALVGSAVLLSPVVLLYRRARQQDRAITPTVAPEITG